MDFKNMMHHFAVQDLGAVDNQEWRIDGIIGDSTNATVPSMYVKRATVPHGFHRYMQLNTHETLIEKKLK